MPNLILPSFDQLLPWLARHSLLFDAFGFPIELFFQLELFVGILEIAVVVVLL